MSVIDLGPGLAKLREHWKATAPEVTDLDGIEDGINRAGNNCSPGMIKMKDGRSFEGEINATPTGDGDFAVEVGGQETRLNFADVASIKIYDDGEWIRD